MTEKKIYMDMTALKKDFEDDCFEILLTIITASIGGISQENNLISFSKCTKD
jgi:hypothetical protein